MGVSIRELVAGRPASLEQLSGKILMVDAYNCLYQFISTIRMRDGALLRDSGGRVTSHLNGLFHRSAHLMQSSLRLSFVFDGKPPGLKRSMIESRQERKRAAQEMFQKAEKEKDVEGMRKYAAMASRLTPEMVEEAKALIEAMGMPVVQAPSEGEAQASYMVGKGDGYAVASQDYDCLMFGAARLVRNLSISGRRKMAGKAAYAEVSPEVIGLEETLRHLGIDQDELIALCALVGTDYNPGGVRGIGPKKALKLVKECRGSTERLLKAAGWENGREAWDEIISVIRGMPVTEEYVLKWRPVNEEKVVELLCERHDFAEGRVRSALQRIREFEKRDAPLSSWLG